MVFVRFFACLLTLVSLWGCTNATPEVSFFNRNKNESIPSSLKETIVGTHTATAAGYKVKATAKVADMSEIQSADGKIKLKGWVE
jgi:hypothetical protein